MCRACQIPVSSIARGSIRDYLKDIKLACREGMRQGPPRWLRKPNRNEDINRLLRSNDPNHVNPITLTDRKEAG